MKTLVNINLPILVALYTDGRTSFYSVRPLFRPLHSVKNRLYEQSKAKLQETIKNRLKAARFDRDNLDHLLWFMFNPDSEYRKIRVNRNLGKTIVDGDYATVAFSVNGNTFGYLPAFDRFFLPTDPTNGHEGIFTDAAEQIARCLQTEKEERKADFEPKRYCAAEKEFVDVLTFEATIQTQEIQLAADLSEMLAGISGDSNFSGETATEETCSDLFESYPKGLLRAFYREDLVEKLYGLLYHGSVRPIVLLGPYGVGKHSLVHEAVYRYRDGQKQTDTDRLCKMWHFDPNRLIAGMSIIGHWQKRFEAVLSYVSARPLFSGGEMADKMLIDNPMAMLRVGNSSQNNMALADVMRPYLEKRRFQTVVLATDEEWKVVRDQDRRFADLFEVFRVPEPDLRTSVRMLIQLRRLLEREHHCHVDPQALSKIFELHRSFFRHRALPGSPAAILRQLVSGKQFRSIGVAEVQDEFVRSVGLNPCLADVNEELDAADLRAFLEVRLVGQPDAVRCLEEIVHTFKARLNDPNKPLGSFLFIGPTGVGKTQAAKVLNEFLFTGEDRLLRLDMNEYLDEDAVDRLIGGGANPEGLLTGKVRYSPFGVVLLDEIEKAHPKVHDLLLQVLDAGRLTDRSGRTVDFSNTVVIMTSNVGAQKASSGIGFSKNDGALMEQTYRSAAEKFFRPEFVNRIGRIVVFRPLGMEHILDIAYQQIRELLGRDGFVRRTTMLNVLPDAIEWVARRGFDAQMGGRALKRQIERDLTSLSAAQLIRAYIDKPIVFTIKLENDRLVPEIETVSFVEPIGNDWLPNLPDTSGHKAFLEKLLEKTEALRDQMLQVSDNSSLPLDHWPLLALRNRADKLIEQLQNIILGTGRDFLDDYAPVLLRLCSSFSKDITHDGEEVDRDLASARFFLENAVEEVRQSYARDFPKYNNVQSALIDAFVEAELLRIQTAALVRSDLHDQVEIRFEPVVEDLGQEEMAYLKKHCLSFLDALEAQVVDEGEQFFAEGYGLLELLSGEEGYHLFYQNHRSPLLVRMVVADANAASAVAPRKKVVRLYEIWQGEQHRSSTLTDLRTGYGNLAAMNAPEFKLLVWAGSQAPAHAQNP
jgi:ATP-dependent Clp protease ATP-binding subunit ClpC